MPPDSPGSPLSFFEHIFVPGYTGATRALVLLHGGTGNENDVLPLGRELDARAPLLSLRGPIFERGLPRFLAGEVVSPSREAEVIARAGQLEQFLRAASQQYRLDPDHYFLVGYSNGATLAVAGLLLYPQRFSGAVLWRPLLPVLPVTVKPMTGKRVWIGGSENDRHSPLEQAELLRSLFKNAGADTALYVSRSGHAIRPPEFAAVRRWINSGAAAESAPTAP